MKVSGVVLMKKMLDRVERNLENRQKRQFENSDTDSDWDMSQVQGLSLAKE